MRKYPGEFQGVQWMLADMATALEASRLLTYQAAWLADRRLPHVKEPSMAKLFATEATTRAAADALQLHGGYGYVMESPIQRLYRDVKLFELMEIRRNLGLVVGDLAELHRSAFALIEEGLRPPRSVAPGDTPPRAARPARRSRARR